MSRVEDEAALDLWWVVPDALAGMPMPFIHPERRAAGGGPLEMYADDLPTLSRVGVLAVVCLLNIPGDKAVYTHAGFAFHLLPIRDGDVPGAEDFEKFLRFVREQRACGHPVVVHCEAGIGRTGTLLAACLVTDGWTPQAAVTHLRTLRPGAVETPRQWQFLHNLQPLPK